jgi:hypothetical protein
MKDWRSEELFETYLSKVIDSFFEAGLVEREKKFKPEIVAEVLKTVLSHFRKEVVDEVLDEVELFLGGTISLVENGIEKESLLKHLRVIKEHFK